MFWYKKKNTINRSFLRRNSFNDNGRTMTWERFECCRWIIKWFALTVDPTHPYLFEFCNCLSIFTIYFVVVVVVQSLMKNTHLRVWPPLAASTCSSIFTNIIHQLYVLLGDMLFKLSRIFRCLSQLRVMFSYSSSSSFWIHLFWICLCCSS